MMKPEGGPSPALGAVELWAQAPDDVRRDAEPVTAGVPWPKGALQDTASLVLEDESGRPTPLQARALDRWPDGSVRWSLLDWQASASGTARYSLRASGQAKPEALPAQGLRVIREGDGLLVDTGVAQFRLAPGRQFPFVSVTVDGQEAVDAERSRFTAEDEAGRAYVPQIERLLVEEAGPVRSAVLAEGRLVSAAAGPLADFIAYLHFFASSATVRFVLTIRNPRRARHPGGLWDLGDEGSIYLRDWALLVTLPPSGGPTVLRCSPELTAPCEKFDVPLELYQDSSGGENWKSSNHVNRHHVVPSSFRGYRLRAGPQERTGWRATPLVSLAQGGRELSVAVRHFWQNFPGAIEASQGAVLLRLFPRQYADVHELQGGEQKTHTFWLAFRPDRVTPEPLHWCRAPLLARAAPSWYCSTGVLPYLAPKADDTNTAYLRLVDAAIEGEDTFEHKREVIDEYGWRHFGDVYGDHEAVFHKQGTAAVLVSHYNNQFDNLAGFVYQFARSGDRRWFQHMEELARHVIDIDVYHTSEDKAAYNHGMFWHTYHYVDADTGTHRAYPRASGSSGGGPSGGHNYATGLVLYHFLTGDPAARATAIDLARWVIEMDDGSKTMYRWLAGGYTGYASASGNPGYYGPERQGANSINALLDGHALTGEPSFLAKAEQLIRRCVHPADDLVRYNLIDAEHRWFYTMFLQAVGRYLDHKAERGLLDDRYAYARASLLHYARWMASYERPNLECPYLHYPTETWPAQDMRKSDVLYYAAKHASGEERARFLARADYFFHYSTNTLSAMKTRALARPVVLLLSNGLMHSYFQQHPEVTAPAPRTVPEDYGSPERFLPQKIRAIRRFRALIAVAAAAATAGGLFGLFYWLR
jgi:hypothetical protein